MSDRNTPAGSISARVLRRSSIRGYPFEGPHPGVRARRASRARAPGPCRGRMPTAGRCGVGVRLLRRQHETQVRAAGRGWTRVPGVGRTPLTACTMSAHDGPTAWVCTTCSGTSGSGAGTPTTPRSLGPTGCCHPTLRIDDVGVRLPAPWSDERRGRQHCDRRPPRSSTVPPTARPHPAEGRERGRGGAAGGRGEARRRTDRRHRPPPRAARHRRTDPRTRRRGVRSGDLRCGSARVAGRPRGPLDRLVAGTARPITAS